MPNSAQSKMLLISGFFRHSTAKRRARRVSLHAGTFFYTRSASALQERSQNRSFLVITTRVASRTKHLLWSKPPHTMRRLRKSIPEDVVSNYAK
jgi:hypothetical protein